MDFALILKPPALRATHEPYRFNARVFQVVRKFSGSSSVSPRTKNVATPGSDK